MERMTRQYATFMMTRIGVEVARNFTEIAKRGLQATLAERRDALSVEIASKKNEIARDAFLLDDAVRSSRALRESIEHAIVVMRRNRLPYELYYTSGRDLFGDATVTRRQAERKNKHGVLASDAMRQYHQYSAMLARVERLTRINSKHGRIKGVKDDDSHYIATSLEKALSRLDKAVADTDGLEIRGDVSRFVDAFLDSENVTVLDKTIRKLAKKFTGGRFFRSYSDSLRYRVMERVCNEFCRECFEGHSRLDVFYALTLNDEFINGNVIDIDTIDVKHVLRIANAFAANALSVSFRRAIKAIAEMLENEVEDFLIGENADTNISEVGIAHGETFGDRIVRDGVSDDDRRCFEWVADWVNENSISMAEETVEAVRKNIGGFYSAAWDDELVGIFDAIFKNYAHDCRYAHLSEDDEKRKLLIRVALKGEKNTIADRIAEIVNSVIMSRICEIMTDNARRRDDEVLARKLSMARRARRKTEGFDDPRAVAENILSSVDDRLDFLLENKQLPDGSGKNNSGMR